MNKEDTNTLTPTYSEKEMCDEIAIAENREEILDMMAQAIANYFGADIGEHSNLNDPWKNALNLLRNAHASLTDEWIPVSGGKLRLDEWGAVILGEHMGLGRLVRYLDGARWELVCPDLAEYVEPSFWKALGTPPKVVGAGENSDV